MQNPPDLFDYCRQIRVWLVTLLSAEKSEDSGYVLFEFKSVADLNDWLKRLK
jgi:hypothetical protein